MSLLATEQRDHDRPQRCLTVWPTREITITDGVCLCCLCNLIPVSVRQSIFVPPLFSKKSGISLCKNAYLLGDLRINLLSLEHRFSLPMLMPRKKFTKIFRCQTVFEGCHTLCIAMVSVFVTATTTDV